MRAAGILPPASGIGRGTGGAPRRRFREGAASAAARNHLPPSLVALLLLLPSLLGESALGVAAFHGSGHHRRHPDCPVRLPPRSGTGATMPRQLPPKDPRIPLTAAATSAKRAAQTATALGQIGGGTDDGGEGRVDRAGGRDGDDPDEGGGDDNDGEEEEEPMLVADVRGRPAGVVIEDLSWRVERLRLEEANTRRFLKSGPRFLPYGECRKWVQAWGGVWQSEAEWDSWIAAGEKRNSYIPSRPEEYYTRTGDWISWDHFLGVKPSKEPPDDPSNDV